jgi:hypothetical protein
MEKDISDMVRIITSGKPYHGSMPSFSYSQAEPWTRYTLCRKIGGICMERGAIESLSEGDQSRGDLLGVREKFYRNRHYGMLDSPMSSFPEQDCDFVEKKASR